MAKVKFNAKQIEAIAQAMHDQRPTGVNQALEGDRAICAQHYLCCASLADMLGMPFNTEVRTAFYDKCGTIR